VPERSAWRSPSRLSRGTATARDGLLEDAGHDAPAAPLTAWKPYVTETLFIPALRRGDDISAAEGARRCSRIRPWRLRRETQAPARRAHRSEAVLALHETSSRRSISFHEEEDAGEPRLLLSDPAGPIFSSGTAGPRRAISFHFGFSLELGGRNALGTAGTAPDIVAAAMAPALAAAEELCRQLGSAPSTSSSSAIRKPPRALPPVGFVATKHVMTKTLD